MSPSHYCGFVCALLLSFTADGFAGSLKVRPPLSRHSQEFGGPLGRRSSGPRDVPPTERWVTQKVDQFTYADKRTWEQRYYMDTKHYVKGGPIFLMLGGERAANPVWLSNGQWVRQALKYKAMLLLLEHRYYGQSRPTPDLSTDNLKFLTVDQALADVANFRGYITHTLSLSNDTTWIIFGGSYAESRRRLPARRGLGVILSWSLTGTLAAWFRLKNPELVNGVVASSAPVYPQKDFQDFYVVTSMSLLAHGPSACYDSLQNVTLTLLNYTSLSGGRDQLKYLLSLCVPLTSNKPQDMATLFSFLASTVGYLVQFNDVAREFEGSKGWNYGIKEFCSTMAGDSSFPQDPIYRYSDFISKVLSNMGQSCIEYRYKEYVSSLKTTDWSSDVADGDRQWLFQSCTEFGFFASSDSKNQPFGNNFPVSYFTQLCTDVFGESVEYILDEAIYNLRQKYGGYKPNISHAIFVNGNYDPWRDLSITENLPDDVTAIQIPGSAHCADMYPDSPIDTVDLVQARLAIDSIVDRWVTKQ